MNRGKMLPLERVLVAKNWTIAQLADAVTPKVTRDVAKRWVRGQLPVPTPYKEQIDALIAEVDADPTLNWSGVGQWLALEVDARRDYELGIDGRTDIGFSPSTALTVIRLARGSRGATQTVATMIGDILARDRQSQADFATRIGVRPATVSDWITGKRKPQAQYEAVIRALHGSLPTDQTVMALESEWRETKEFDDATKQRMAEAQRGLNDGELSPYEYYLLLRAIGAQAEDQRQADFILELVEHTANRELLDRAIERLIGSVWWPWK